jgi:hypothetical protein
MNEEMVIEGIKQRDDLKPKRGWSTSPNVFRDPTYYEVLGTGFNNYSAQYVLIDHWLAANKPHLALGTRHGSYGTTTEVVATFRDGRWFVVSYFTYSGG